MYAYYKSGAKEQTIDQTEAFIRENPTSSNIDYALYIQALAHFEEEPDILEKTFNKNMNKRPPSDVETSFSILERLVTRYPASDYAADAELRMIYLKNRLAAYENIVADYYIRSGAYVAALNRSKDALEKYNGVPSNEESLQIMLKAYQALGMTDLANDTRSVLINNYGSSQETLNGSQNTFIGPQERLNSSQDVFISPQERLNSSQDTFIGHQETLNSSQDTFIGPQERLNSSQDVFIGSQERLNSSQDTFIGPQERLNSSQDVLISPQERELSENKQDDQPQKEVPKFWQRIKTLLPKTLNRNK
jgi:outer membrane assembly lipoprotein YfiO